MLIGIGQRSRLWQSAGRRRRDISCLNHWHQKKPLIKGIKGFNAYILIAQPLVPHACRPAKN